jgi:hypothetical protein
MTQPPSYDPSQVVGKTALSTIVVIVTLFVVLCVLPCAGCQLLGLLGSVG